MKITFKVKRTEGVGIQPDCSWVTYIGNSRIDGFPIFQIEYDSGPNISHLIQDALIVNTKPGYTIQGFEIELIRSLECDLPIKNNIQMSAPSGMLYYLDFVYNDTDERLLLML